MSVYITLELWAKVTTEILGVDVLQQRSEVLKCDWGKSLEFEEDVVVIRDVGL